MREEGKKGRGGVNKKSRVRSVSPSSIPGGGKGKKKKGETRGRKKKTGGAHPIVSGILIRNYLGGRGEREERKKKGREEEGGKRRETCPYFRLLLRNR